VSEDVVGLVLGHHQHHRDDSECLEDMVLHKLRAAKRVGLLRNSWQQEDDARRLVRFWDQRIEDRMKVLDRLSYYDDE